MRFPCACVRTQIHINVKYRIAVFIAKRNGKYYTVSLKYRKVLGGPYISRITARRALLKDFPLWEKAYLCSNAQNKKKI